MENGPNRLMVLWVTQDREAAKHMIFMYTKNSKLRGWWEHVRLVVWGPSANLLAADEELQAELQELKAAGVELLACKACADRYGVSETLTSLGCDVIYMGIPLTEHLKEGWATLSV
jgi:hypothetical protein